MPSSPQHMRDDFDGIILGTGHNALVLQAYMARSGLRVLSLDRAKVAGGGLATIENPCFPGFLHNTHSFFIERSPPNPIRWSNIHWRRRSSLGSLDDFFRREFPSGPVRHSYTEARWK